MGSALVVVTFDDFNVRRFQYYYYMFSYPAPTEPKLVSRKHPSGVVWLIGWLVWLCPPWCYFADLLIGWLSDWLVERLVGWSD